MNRTTAFATVALALLAATPLTAADTTIRVDDGNVHRYPPAQPISNPFPEIINFELGSTHFNETNPLNAFFISTHTDWGQVGIPLTANCFGARLTPRAHEVLYHITTNSTDVVEVRYRTSLQVDCLRTTQVLQEVFVNGELRWTDVRDYTISVLLGGSLAYTSNAAIGWAANGTTTFTGSFTGDTAQAHSAQQHAGGRLFLVTQYEDQKFLTQTGNGTEGTSIFAEVPLYDLGNLSNVAYVSVTTAYERDSPETSEYLYRFWTYADRLNWIQFEEERCPGIKGAVERFIGFCPTLENLLGWVANKVAGATSHFLGLIPGLDGIAESGGTIVGVIVGAYSFVLLVMLTNPIDVLLVWIGHVFYYAALAAAWQGDMTILPSATGRAVAITGKALWIYFTLLFIVAKAAWTALLSLFQGIATWVRG